MYTERIQMYTLCIQTDIIEVMKMIRIDDDQYRYIENKANEDGRSITSCLFGIINREINPSTKEATTYKQPTKSIETGFGQHGFPVYKKEPVSYSIEEGITAAPTNGRTIVKVLDEINKMKLRIEHDMNYCQDADAKHQIEADGKIKLNELWGEYRTLKAR